MCRFFPDFYRFFPIFTIFSPRRFNPDRDFQNIAQDSPHINHINVGICALHVGLYTVMKSAYKHVVGLA